MPPRCCIAALVLSLMSLAPASTHTVSHLNNDNSEKKVPSTATPTFVEDAPSTGRREGSRTEDINTILEKDSSSDTTVTEADHSRTGKSTNSGPQHKQGPKRDNSFRNNFSSSTKNREAVNMRIEADGIDNVAGNKFQGNEISSTGKRDTRNKHNEHVKEGGLTNLLNHSLLSMNNSSDTKDPNLKGDTSSHILETSNSSDTKDPNLKGDTSSHILETSNSSDTKDPNLKGDTSSHILETNSDTKDPNLKGDTSSHILETNSDTKDPNLKGDTSSHILETNSDTKDPNLKGDTSSRILETNSDTKDPNLKGDTSSRILETNSDTKDPNLKGDTSSRILETNSDTKDPNLKGDQPSSHILETSNSSDTKDPNLKGDTSPSHILETSNSSDAKDPNLKGDTSSHILETSNSSDAKDPNLKGGQPSSHILETNSDTKDPNLKGDQASSHILETNSDTKDPNLKGGQPSSHILETNSDTKDPNLKGDQASSHILETNSDTKDPNLKGDTSSHILETNSDTKDPNLKGGQPSSRILETNIAAKDPNLKGGQPSSHILETNSDTKDPNLKGGQPSSHILETNTRQLLSPATTDTPQTGSRGNFPDECEHSCCKVSDTVVTCSGCHLECVPTDLPRSITTLMLDNNNISSDALYPGVFSAYAELEALILDSNNITVLPDHAFDGLVSLKTLSVYNNRISLNEQLNVSKVFFPLNNTLETLIINRNTEDRKNGRFVYPDHALSVLTQLSLLHIDGLRNKRFGIGFQNLTKLTNLSVSGTDGRGYCYIISIRNDTFQYFKYLTFLDISGCNLKGPHISLDAFGHLDNLEVLDVSDNLDLGINNVGNFMYGLQNKTNFTYLKMARVVPRFAPCVIIYKHTLRYFNNSRLQVIEAMSNEIEMIEYGALELLPKTLKLVNLTNNRIMFGDYWENMASLEQLEVLHLDGLQKAAAFPLFFPSGRWHCMGPNDNPSLSSEQNYEKKCMCGNETCSITEFPLPPQLNKFTMHSNALSYKISTLQFCHYNNLTSVDLSYNVFQELQGPITGLTVIKELNLTSCFIETISDTFFDNLTSLEDLNLYLNLLGDHLNTDEDGKVFDSLTNLKSLNLSFNNLYRLNSATFKDLKNLEVLDLSTNRLNRVTFSVQHMKNLRFLDLHKNDISTLPEELMKLVDDLLEMRRNVTIDMSANPISCDCENLDFLEWVVKTKIFGNNYTYYYCKECTVNGNITEMRNGYEEEVIQLRRYCSTHVILFMGVAGGTFLLVVFILGLLFYRFRWTLRYWFHAAKLKLYARQHQNDQHYDYDVFISYASEDVNFILNELSHELSSKRNLNLMIHGETFQAGRHIADNIYMAVRQSRKTLVLVTRNMLDSHWCTYELQMARQESISTGRDVLVFLFLEEIQASLISVDVMSYIKTSTYVMYPEDVSHREAFWNKLADDLRDE